MKPKVCHGYDKATKEKLVTRIFLKSLKKCYINYSGCLISTIPAL